MGDIQLTAELNRVCVFISSSDNTRDVFELISPSILEAFPFSTRFVGLNQTVDLDGFTTVRASVSNWNGELAEQIDKLPNEFDYVILILDDFYFHRKVDKEKLLSVIHFAQKEQVDYVRLIPVEASAFIKLLRWMLYMLYPNNIPIRLKESEPYYSSLQVAIWNRNYLSNLLSLSTNIWEFEHISVSKSKHYAVTNKICFYEHLVEKGRWLRHARNLIKNVSNDSFDKRGYDKRKIYRYKFIREIKFKIYGYNIFRFKRFIKVLIDKYKI